MQCTTKEFVFVVYSFVFLDLVTIFNVNMFNLKAHASLFTTVWSIELYMSALYHEFYRGFASDFTNAHGFFVSARDLISG